MTSTNDSELLALRIRKAELLRRRLEMIKQHGLAFYRPWAKPAAFHVAGMQYRLRMFRAGNRAGKSTMGCAEDCSWLLGERSWVPSGDPLRTGGIPPHPVKLQLITQDWDLANDVWVSQRGGEGKMWKFLPPAAIKSVRRNHSGCIDTIEVKREAHLGGGESVFKIDTVKSWQSNPMGSESKDWDAIHVDEPCPEGMWKACARGLMDRRGAAWFTLTPLTEFWINDMFFPQETGGKPRDDVWTMTASTDENPYLSEQAISDFKNILTEDEQQCRLHGIPLHLTGLIYKEFSWDTHVLKKPPEGWDGWMPPKNYPVYLQFDVHPRTPHCVLFSTVLPTGERVYFEDIFHHSPMPELAELVKRKLDGRRIVWAEMDPLGFIEHPTSETTMADDLTRCGIFCEKATKALERGILKVKQGLKDKQIFFTPTARRALWEIQRYCWDEETNKPIDKDDHAMECLYRMEVAEPRFIDLGAVVDTEVTDEAIPTASTKLEDIEFADVV